MAMMDFVCTSTTNCIIDNWKKQTYSTLLADYYFEKDKKYDIRIEFFEPVW